MDYGIGCLFIGGIQQGWIKIKQKNLLCTIVGIVTPTVKPTVCQQPWYVEARSNQILTVNSTQVLNFIFSSIMVPVWNLWWWGDLCHGNQQKLHIRTFLPTLENCLPQAQNGTWLVTSCQVDNTRFFSVTLWVHRENPIFQSWICLPSLNAFCWNDHCRFRQCFIYYFALHSIIFYYTVMWQWTHISRVYTECSILYLKTKAYIWRVICSSYFETVSLWSTAILKLCNLKSIWSLSEAPTCWEYKSAPPCLADEISSVVKNAPVLESRDIITNAPFHQHD
jgi:hypothetical protein